MRCGLLGGKLGHSYSPQIHKHLGNYSYELFEKTPEELADFLANGDYTGLNVTIPYKKAVIPYCAELSARARQLGAVNTLVRRNDGTLIGHNTDYSGFAAMVRHSGINPAGKKALVLGSGGASNTAVAVLTQMGAAVTVISRTGANNYTNLHLHKDAQIIVNATPVGTYPNTGVAPLDLSRFPCLEGVLDLVYNPARTQLLLDAQALEIPCANGLWMLVAQAKESAEWFTGASIDDGIIPKIYKSLRAQMENIILIGMPGAGKSTVGTQLAQKLGRRFVDADTEIEALAGCAIPEIFRTQGEVGFRAWETKALAEIGKQSGLVIATGGGCVTREENYPLLHQNGLIVWLQRDWHLLPTEGRPLSKPGTLGEMLSHREPMYRRFADFSIENEGDISETVSAILTLWEDSL